MVTPLQGCYHSPFRSLAPVLAAYDGAAELERGLDILLTGLAATLPLPGGARSSSQAG